MGDDESEEEEREDLFLDTGAHKTSQPRESRKDREDKLKQMMDGQQKPTRKLDLDYHRRT